MWQELPLIYISLLGHICRHEKWMCQQQHSWTQQIIFICQNGRIKARVKKVLNSFFFHLVKNYIYRTRVGSNSVSLHMRSSIVWDSKGHVVTCCTSMGLWIQSPALSHMSECSSCGSAVGIPRASKKCMISRALLVKYVWVQQRPMCENYSH